MWFASTTSPRYYKLQLRVPPPIDAIPSSLYRDHLIVPVFEAQDSSRLRAIESDRGLHRHSHIADVRFNPSLVHCVHYGDNRHNQYGRLLNSFGTTTEKRVLTELLPRKCPARNHEALVTRCGRRGSQNMRLRQIARVYEAARGDCQFFFGALLIGVEDHAPESLGRGVEVFDVFNFVDCGLREDNLDSVVHEREMDQGVKLTPKTHGGQRVTRSKPILPSFSFTKSQAAFSARY